MKSNKDILDKFAKERYDDCIKLACRYTSSRSDAEDCVQTAFLNATINIHTYDSSRVFDYWFIKILTNVCFDHLRSSVRRKEIPFSCIDSEWKSVTDFVLSGNGFDDLIINKLDKEKKEKALRNALASLSDERLNLLCLAYYKETPVDLLAAWTGTTVNAVWCKLFRIKKIIKDHIKENYEES